MGTTTAKPFLILYSYPLDVKVISDRQIRLTDCIGGCNLNVSRKKSNHDQIYELDNFNCLL